MSKNKKYEVYVNAGIEIWSTVEAKSEAEAHDKAYDLIGHRDYDCTIEVKELDESE